DYVKGAVILALESVKAYLHFQRTEPKVERERAMLSTTLSQSLLRAHALPSSSKRTNKSNALDFVHEKNSAKHPLLSFSWYSREYCCVNTWEGWFKSSPQEVYMEVKYHDFKNLEPAKNENLINTGVGLFNTSFCGLRKFMMLFGFLTLEGSDPAVAASNIESGLQSIPYLQDLGDISTGFASAFLLIFFSELGDKTFFIAALLAARNSAAIVFLGTFGALAVMTIISVVLGRTFHYVDEILPFRFGETDLPIDDIAAVCLLVYFGVSSLLDAASSESQKAEDEQKEAELAVSEFSGNGAGILAAANTVISTFLLVFVAEWGDKSFFSTIALAAASSPLGVIGGALAGHGVATLLAVLGGSLLGTLLSEKAIAYIGGVLFLIFAVVTVIEIVS
ncbi:UPF0016 domain-containing protein, partial [Cephalotus follicularis]